MLAPTGTISFLMDCDTTGIEPDIALVKYRQLAGGGMIKIVNRTVPMARRTLGYDHSAIEKIAGHIDDKDTIEGAPGLSEDHLPVFDCAFPPAGGGHSIPWRAHVRMMAAAQPFLSGAISKTVNMPRESTPADIAEAYIEGWRMGLKALAVYRDGSKESQPLNTSSESSQKAAKAAAVPRRERLPDTRRSLTHKFSVAGHEGYITVGLYDDGRPGELFITMAKEGSTVGGLMDCFGTAVSMSWQYGVPLEVYVSKFSHTRFEPMGPTNNRDIPLAKSLVDYIFRWLGMEFIPGFREANSPAAQMEAAAREAEEAEAEQPPVAVAKESSGDRRDSDSGQKATGTVTLESSPVRKTSSSKPTANGRTAEDELRLERSGGAMRVGTIDRSAQFASFQADAPSCDRCGAITVRNGNCYLCHNCGNSMGCS